MTPSPGPTGRPSLDARAAERLAGGLGRLTPWVIWVARLAAGLGFAALLAGLVLWALVLDVNGAGSLIDWIGLGLLLAALATPGGILLLFVVLLRQLLALPGQLRDAPLAARAHGGQVVGALGDLRRPGTTGRGGRVRAAVRLVGTLLAARGLLEPFIGLAGLAKWPYLILVAVAALVAVFEIVVCVLVVLAIALV